MILLPQRPRLVFRAGFAGRRVLSGSEQTLLSAALHDVFSTLGHKLAAMTRDVPVSAGKEPPVAAYFARQTPLLRLITGLCEGADALAAQTLKKVQICPDHGSTCAPETRCLETELAAVLPFDVKVYRRSRPPAFQPEFDRQLAACAWVLELDGSYEKPDPPTLTANHRRASAYRAQAAFLLRQSDLLIAAADPSIPSKAGGTLETVREAQVFELPVVFIHTGTGAVYLIAPEDDLHEVLAGDVPPPEKWKEQLCQWVFQLTADPDSGLAHDAEHDSESRQHAESLLNEFFDDAQSPQQQAAKRMIRWRKAAWEKFEKHFRSGPGSKSDPKLAPYSDYRDRATALNRHYSALYRGAFLLNYVAAITAVVLATFCLGLLAVFGEEPWLHPVLLCLTTVKLLIVIFIWQNTHQANHEKWNDRAVSFRYLAERLRGMYYLAQIGSQQPPAASAQHFASRAVRQSVIDWLFDSIVRSISPAELKDIKAKDAALFTAPVSKTLSTHDGSGTLVVKMLMSPRALDAVGNVRDGWIKEQIAYHAREAHGKHRLHEFLEKLASRMSIAVIVIVLTDLVITLLAILHHVHEVPECIEGLADLASSASPYLVPVLIFGSAVLPAVIAALGGIRFQSECQRIAERSSVMRSMLAGDESEDSTKGLHHEAERLSADMKNKAAGAASSPGSQDYRALRFIERTATVFVHEAAEWSVLYAKDLSDPG